MSRDRLPANGKSNPESLSQFYLANVRPPSARSPRWFHASCDRSQSPGCARSFRSRDQRRRRRAACAAFSTHVEKCPEPDRRLRLVARAPAEFHGPLARTFHIDGRTDRAPHSTPPLPAVPQAAALLLPPAP